jgi:tRNA threonylcarbamoyladenosine biosynthesis protein TsaB
MAIILNIDTSGETAIVCIAENGKVVHTLTNQVQKEHATFLHPAIETVVRESGFGFKDIDAIAVTEGPGSYTGLRVGMAAAKGLSYALSCSFITIGTLPAMVQALLNKEEYDAEVFIPMIDARRMEVFTAVYDKDLNEIVAPSAMILQINSFEEILKNGSAYFVGSGSEKCKELISSPNAHFVALPHLAQSLSVLSFKKYKNGEFANLPHSQPLYIKEFFNG